MYVREERNIKTRASCLYFCAVAEPGAVPLTNPVLRGLDTHASESSGHNAFHIPNSARHPELCASPIVGTIVAASSCILNLAQTAIHHFAPGADQQDMRLITLMLVGIVGTTGPCRGAFGKPNAGKQPTYSGATLERWNERMKDIDPKSSNAIGMVDPLIAIIRDTRLPGADREPFAAYLARIGRPAKRAVPILADLIDRRHENSNGDHLWAARALALMGEPANSATPSLVELLFDDRMPVSHRQSAVEAIARIGSAHPDTAPALLRLLRYRTSPQVTAEVAASLRFLAAESIFISGPETAELAAPLLIRMIRDPRESQRTRRSAIVGLGSLELGGAVAVQPLLEELVIGQDPACRDAAANSLVRIGEPVLPSLRRCLVHPDPEVRWRVAYSLRELVRPTGDLKPDIMKLREDQEALVRICACETLVKLWGGDSTDVIDTVISLLEEENRIIRMRAKRLLVTRQTLEPRQIDRLREMSRDNKRYGASVARATLKQLLP